MQNSIQNSITANQLSGRAIGAMIFTGFGSLWLVLALYTREILSVTSVAGIVLIAAGLFLLSIRLKREARRFPRTPDDPRIGRVFHIVNAAEWAACFIVAQTLHHFHLDLWTVPAIAGIVGSHFFPLARLFGYPLHYVTGSLMVLWAVGASVFAPVEHVQSITAMGAGIILWCSAVATLAIGLRKASHAPASFQGVRSEAA